ncbi:MAG TPA: TniQ family protein [Terriglobales bacterium]|nr:TniQ family protein [Terriglobales bacterium]
MSGRLLFRVDPVAGESPRGYLCRTAHDHGYGSPNALAQIAGLWVSGTGKVTGLDQDAAIKQLSYTLRLDPEEWGSMCYTHVKGRNRFKQRSFYGETISADDLNYRKPRLCTACLRDHPIWWAVWDLGLIVACPVHRCFLLNQCPACKRKIVWERPAVHKCRCGLDFRQVTSEPADPGLVAINAIVCRAAKFTLAETAGVEVADFGFPPELLQLELGALLRFILFVGAINDGSILRRKQRPFRATDLAGAVAICRGAVALLRDWSRPLQAVLQRMIPQSANPSTLNFSDIFGNFYRHLFRVLPRREFGFLHDAFEEFVIKDWKGFIRGQHRYFSAAVRRNSHWVTANEAETIARISGTRIWDHARNGQLDAIFLNVRQGGTRTECWIRRESLARWVAARDADLAPYMTRPEAEAALGLKNFTLSTVAAAGAIRYMKGPERNFPAGCFFFLREDVMKIKQAFEKHSVPVTEYSKPREFIALRHAMKNYLGRDSGLAGVIRAVVDGSLVPTGRTNRYRGITGYLFRSEDLRKYRPTLGAMVPPEGFLSFKEAAGLLGVRTNVIRGLTDQGMLTASNGFRNGFARLLPAKEVQQFAEHHVSTSVLAKRFQLNSGSLARYLNESNIPLLAIPIPDAGKGHAFFLQKDFAVRIQLPSRRMMREAAQRRIVAARKKRWAEYRRAREAALGKPMRRVRANG